MEEKKLIAKKQVIFGFTVIATLFTLFVGWSILAPISSASIASGKVILSKNVKNITHLEGGIVQKIYVSEGDNVKKKDLLLRLSDVEFKAQRQISYHNLEIQRIKKNRLNLEIQTINNEEYFINPDKNPLTIINKKDKKNKNSKRKDKSNMKITEILLRQEDIFQSKRSLLNTKIDIIDKKLQGLKDERDAISAQIESSLSKLEILKQRKDIISSLVKSGNESKITELDIKMQVVSLEGKINELKARRAQSYQTIAGTRNEILDIKQDAINQAMTEAQEVQEQILELEESIRLYDDKLQRRDILSPSSGIVTAVKFHTEGSVIPPSTDIMTIVPQDDKLIIEARILPNDIESVYSGLNAKVQLLPFSAKKVPKLTGVVTTVAPDITTDEATGEQFFLARIEINKEQINNIKGNITLHPGMMVQVFIIANKTSFARYLFSPIIDAAYKAFREN